MIPVSRDASAITGRPHVFLADLLAVASSEAQGQPFVVMNADLLIPPNMLLGAKVAQLRPGELIFSRRIDIDQPAQTNGAPYHWGYDFFAGHADDISRLPDAGMILGAPWWDYFFPLMMFGQHCRLYQTEPAVLHLKHTDQWSWAVWDMLGQRFVAEAEACVGDEAYKSRLDDAVKGRDDTLNGRSARLLSDLKFAPWKRSQKNEGSDTRRMLLRVADANLSFLDKTALAVTL
jgi:hypothetical protein